MPTAHAIEAFDTALQTTHQWLNELCERMGWATISWRGVRYMSRVMLGGRFKLEFVQRRQFPIVHWRWGRPDVATAVSVAIFAACSVASTVAMALPWILKSLRQDPAFAAGPLATVIQDLLSVLIYLLICLAVV